MAHTVTTHAPTQGDPARPMQGTGVSLAKPGDRTTPARVHPWEINYRLNRVNSRVRPLSGHGEGLAMNDPETLRSMFAILARTR